MATKKHREKQVEARISERAREHAGTAYKFTSPSRRSVPDRLIAVPCMAWLGLFLVEAKAEGEVPTKPQEREHERLRKVGACVSWVDGYPVVDFMFEVFF